MALREQRLRDETEIPAYLAESPLTCVAIGSGRSLEEIETLRRSDRDGRRRTRRR